MDIGIFIFLSGEFFFFHCTVWWLYYVSCFVYLICGIRISWLFEDIIWKSFWFFRWIYFGWVGMSGVDHDDLTPPVCWNLEIVRNQIYHMLCMSISISYILCPVDMPSKLEHACVSCIFICLGTKLSLFLTSSNSIS